MADFMKEIGLNKREPTREKNKSILPQVDCEKIIHQFRNNIKNISNKFEMYNNLVNSDLNDEAEDILRSQIVFIFSSLDFYMHEIIKYVIIKMFSGERPKTVKYKNFIVSIDTLERAIREPENIDWLTEEIIIRHGRKTFMSSKEIKLQIELISKIKSPYKKIADNMSIKEKELDDKIKTMYTRRNNIVHQSDRDPATNILNKINVEYVRECLKLINEVVENIHKIIVENDE